MLSEGTKKVSSVLTRTLGLWALGPFLLRWDRRWTFGRMGTLGLGFCPPVLLPLPVVLPLYRFNPSEKQAVLHTHQNTKYLQPQKQVCTLPSLSCSAPLPLLFSWTSPKVSCHMTHMHLYKLWKHSSLLVLGEDHSLLLLLLLFFNDLVGFQCHLLLVHQLLPVQLPAGLQRQPLLIRHKQLAALRDEKHA